MKNQPLRFYILVFCILLFPITANTLEVADLDNQKIVEAFVDGLVYPLMKENHSPSSSVAIVKDGKVIFSKGYGFQDIENHVLVSPEATLFRQGSISKLFTWVAVMQMVEQGNLDLDVDINTYLKTVKIKNTFPDQPITMWHLMTHTAGFEDGGLGHLIIKDIKKALPLADAMEKYQPERVNPPGVQAAYSNYGAALAGLVVADLSGMEFSDYIEKNIFSVLGMTTASFKEPLPNRLNKNIAIAYAYENERYIAKPFEIISNFAPAGSLSATVADMAKFSQAILNGGEYDGGRILKENTTRKMLARAFSHDERLPAMALGFFETEQNTNRVIGHDGDTMYFHSDLTIDLKNNLALVSSFGGKQGSNISKAFAPAFYDTFFPSKHVKLDRPSDFSDRAEKYTGNYQFWRSSFSTIEKASKLSDAFSVQSTDENSLVISGFGEFVEIDNNLFQQVTGSMKIAFQENATGDITGFVTDFAPYVSMYKVPASQNASLYRLLSVGSFLLFVGVVLRRLYQGERFAMLSIADKRVANASFITAIANLSVLFVGAFVLISAGDDLYLEILLSFKFWLVLPIIATVLGMYHAYNSFLVWRNELCGSVWARVRYSIVSFCALFMCWFYYYWNILGYQYPS